MNLGQVISVLTFHGSTWWLLSFLSWFLLEVHATSENVEAHYLAPSNNFYAEPFSSFVISHPFSRSYSQNGSGGLLISPSMSSSGNVTSVSSNLRINEIPRLPVWNGETTGSDQRHIDFSQLFELMGEPRGSRGRELSELITRPKPKCNRRIRLLNGVTRIRERGSLARFQCSHGFTLIGPTTIVCLRDRWSEPPPICVKSGCRPIRRPQNAEVRQSIGGAVVAFYCLGETTLLGDPILFCDGIRWNGTEPTCYTEPAIVATPEPDSDEAWPEFVATPSLLNSAVQNTESSIWDNNLVFTSFPEVRTTGHPAETDEPQLVSDSTTESVTGMDGDKETTTFENPHIPETTQPLPSIRLPDHEPSTETSVMPHQVEIVTEKHPEEPAPSTTKHPMVLTQQMGQNDTGPVITASAPAAKPTTVIPSLSVAPKLPTMDLTTISPPLEPQPPRIRSSVPIMKATTEHIFSNSVINSTNNLSTTTTTTTTTPAPKPATPRRRVKIITKRPRRLTTTRRPVRRPLGRRTTTTAKPRKSKYPTFLTRTSLPPAPMTAPPTQPLSTSTPVAFIPGFPQKDLDSPPAPADYPVAIDKEFLPREQVEPIRPIIFPDMLNNNAYPGENASRGGEVGHVSMIIGILLVVVGLSTFSGGVVLYCWRKNKGIARARPYDMDGRTLSAHDANDDFMWVDQRDSGL